MLKLPITFKNLDEEIVKETHYFNLTTAECIEFTTDQADNPGDLEERLKEVIEDGRPSKVINLFKDLIAKAYGRRIDGRFFKRAEFTEEFLASEAYSTLFMSLVTNAMDGAEFIKGIMPADLDEQAAKIREQSGGVKGVTVHQSVFDEANDIPSVSDTPPPRNVDRSKQVRMSREEILAGMRSKSQPRVLTYKDVTEMTQAQLDAALAAGATIAQD